MFNFKVLVSFFFCAFDFPRTTFGETAILQWLNALTAGVLTQHDRLPVHLKDLLKVNQHPSPIFRFPENDFPFSSNSHPQANASKSLEEEETRTSIPKNFEKYAAVDIVYKTMACFGSLYIAHSASSGYRNRFNKNMLNLHKENEIPIV